MMVEKRSLSGEPKPDVTTMRACGTEVRCRVTEREATSGSFSCENPAVQLLNAYSSVTENPVESHSSFREKE